MKKRTGWVIGAGALLVILAGGAFIMLQPRTLGEPSEAIRGRMGAIACKADLAGLVEVPAGRGAEILYDNAVGRAITMGKASDFPAMTIKTLEPENDPQFRLILDDLISGGQTGIADDVVLLFPELAADGPHEAKVTEFLTALVTVPANAADSLIRDQNMIRDQGQAREKKWAAATEMANAGLVFSYRLWRHGLSWSSRQAGLTGMGKALAELKIIYARTGKTALAEAVARCEMDRAATAKKWEDKAHLTFLHSPLALHPPDLLYMATHDEDRTWRLQGVKWLGVARYSGATEQDREAINRELEKLFVSRDEVFAAMARQSHELTLEDVRILLP